MMSSSPCVTAIDECSGLRPVANAFGAVSGTTYTRGFGTPAAIASPSTTLCSRGSCSGVTSFARADASTTLSPAKYDPIDRAIARPAAKIRPAGPRLK